MAANGLTFNVAEAGPEDGPLVLMLHGFPESWYGWRHQIGPLAEAGFRVVAPDQRGYGASSRPRGVDAYRLDHLVDDVVGLVAALGRGRASGIVAHDWGGIVAWAAIERHPERFERAVILNAPHPAAMQASLRSDPAQQLRSWYIALFQVPGLAEWALGRKEHRALIRGMTTTARPGTFEPSDLEVERANWSEPGALRAMLNWYRAARRLPRLPWPDSPIRVPTRLIWGSKDHALGPGVARLSYAQCQTASLEWIDEATHWVAHEEPARVAALILDWLRRGPTDPPGS